MRHIFTQQGSFLHTEHNTIKEEIYILLSHLAFKVPFDLCQKFMQLMRVDLYVPIWTQSIFSGNVFEGSEFLLSNAFNDTLEKKLSSLLCLFDVLN